MMRRARSTHDGAGRGRAGLVTTTFGLGLTGATFFGAAGGRTGVTGRTAPGAVCPRGGWLGGRGADGLNGPDGPDGPSGGVAGTA
ncbi:MAG TPA: hypothetical protein VLT79_12065 [Gemmatimonadales bacterium]|nr:hypothetical protein [Gemmatimonadales bacterium]